jgi:hypothetical protein
MKQLKLLCKMYSCHEDICGSGYIEPWFLDLGTSWRRWVVSFTPRPLYLWERAPGTHWMGDWLGLRAGQEDVEKANSSPYRDCKSEPSVIQPIASRYTDCAISAPSKIYFIISHSQKIFSSFAVSSETKFHARRRLLMSLSFNELCWVTMPLSNWRYTLPRCEAYFVPLCILVLCYCKTANCITNDASSSFFNTNILWNSYTLICKTFNNNISFLYNNHNKKQLFVLKH